MDDPAELLTAFRAGEPRALARAISLCESGRGAELIRALYPLTGRALTIGLTGPPGVGKSTLSGALIAHVRAQGKTVGVVSVDPSSPFSHGALLGDRIRLTEHFIDPDVFIRSMASRGHLGGLSGATADAVSLMDAFGKDIVLIETVGVGQSDRRGRRHDAGRTAARQRRLGASSQGRRARDRRRIRGEQERSSDGAAAAARDSLDDGDAELRRLDSGAGQHAGR
jgi:putative protein kinase ArgK-like GTPase of G3E family